jgi:hypothetical protein
MQSVRDALDEIKQALQKDTPRYVIPAIWRHVHTPQFLSSHSTRCLSSELTTLHACLTARITPLPTDAMPGTPVSTFACRVERTTVQDAAALDSGRDPRHQTAAVSVSCTFSYTSSTARQKAQATPLDRHFWRCQRGRPCPPLSTVAMQPSYCALNVSWLSLHRGAVHRASYNYLVWSLCVPQHVRKYRLHMPSSSRCVAPHTTLSLACVRARTDTHAHQVLPIQRVQPARH